jgi:RNA polymerase sigma-70 factor (ECF subfamily)
MLDTDERRALERALRAMAAHGDLAGVVTAAMKGYGAELFALLQRFTGDRDRAADLYGSLWEQVWKGLPAFRWESSFRVWAYAIARNEFLTAVRADRVRREVVVAVEPPDVPEEEQPPMPTGDELDQLRGQLDPDALVLLGLRVDHRLSWNQIARVVGRDAAVLRKRYQRIKSRLAAAARSASHTHLTTTAKSLRKLGC